MFNANMKTIKISFHCVRTNCDSGSGSDDCWINILLPHLFLESSSHNEI